jgi:chemotaxis protein methyltransferase CheR
VLSAGCSSGEEAFTLAILLRENFPQAVAGSVEILGVDVSPGLLARAAAGRFTEWSLRQTSPPMRQRYFTRDRGELLLDGSIRRAVAFARRNLLDEDPIFYGEGAFDVIFCRNVTMYFAPAQTRALVQRLARALAPGGYLFLGPAETLRGISDAFQLCASHETFYYRLGEGPSEVLRPAPPPAVRQPPRPSYDDSWYEAIGRASRRIAQLSRTMTPTPALPPAPAAPALSELGHVVELLQQHRFSEAAGVLRGLSPEAHADPRVQLLVAQLLVENGELEDAQATCERMLALDGRNAGAHYLMALCRAHAGDRPAARAHDEAACSIDPGFSMPRLHLGLLAKAEGRPDLVRREFRQAAQLLAREDPGRIARYGSGFNREALLRLCQGELTASGAGS